MFSFFSLLASLTALKVPVRYVMKKYNIKNRNIAIVITVNEVDNLVRFDRLALDDLSCTIALTRPDKRTSEPRHNKVNNVFIPNLDLSNDLFKNNSIDDNPNTAITTAIVHAIVNQ